MFEWVGETINWLTGVCCTTIVFAFIFGFLIYFIKERWRDLYNWFERKIN